MTAQQTPKKEETKAKAPAPAPVKKRTFLDVAKDMDKVQKAVVKVQSQLDACQKQIDAMEAKKKTHITEIGDLDEDMDELKKEYEGLLDG